MSSTAPSITSAGAFAQAGSLPPSLDSTATLHEFFWSYHIGNRMGPAADTGLKLVSKKTSQKIHKMWTSFAIQEKMLEQMQLRFCLSKDYLLDLFYPEDDAAFFESFKQFYKLDDATSLAKSMRIKFSYLVKHYLAAKDMSDWLKDHLDTKSESMFVDFHAILGKYFKEHPKELKVYLSEPINEAASLSDRDFGKHICSKIAYVHKDFDPQEFYASIAVIILRQDNLQQKVADTVSTRIRPARFTHLVNAMSQKLVSENPPNISEQVRLTFASQHKLALILNRENISLLKSIPPNVDAVLDAKDCDLPLNWFFPGKHAGKFVQLNFSSTSPIDAGHFSRLIQALPNLTKLNVTAKLEQESLNAIAKIKGLVSLFLQGSTLPTSKEAFLPFSKIGSIDLARTNVTIEQVQSLASKITIDLRLQQCPNLKLADIEALHTSFKCIVYSDLR